jgi:hypothetical protein
MVACFVTAGWASLPDAGLPTPARSAAGSQTPRRLAGALGHVPPRLRPPPETMGAASCHRPSRCHVPVGRHRPFRQPLEPEPETLAGWPGRGIDR